MKVICINDKGWIISKFRPVTTSYLWGLKKVINQQIVREESTGPAKNDIVTVIDQMSATTGTPGIYYSLEEWPVDVYGSYSAKCFVPLAELEENIKSKIEQPEPALN